jgi:hypothetical protein
MVNDRPRRINILQVLLAVGVLVLFVGAYVASLNFYFNEGAQRSSAFTSGSEDPNNISAITYITGVDPIKGEMSARTEFSPNGNISNEDNFTLSRDVNVFLTNSGGKQEHEYKKGKPMNPIDAVVSFNNTRPTDYPFDVHTANFEVVVTGNEDGVIPLNIDFSAAVPGFNIDAVENKVSAGLPNYFSVDVRVSRSTTTKIFSIFIMGAMWIVSLSVMFMTWVIFTRRRKMETVIFTFVSTLIFALPAVRNIQPGVPPIGALSDFIAFFWAEVIAIVCLLIVVYCWLRPDP